METCELFVGLRDESGKDHTTAEYERLNAKVRQQLSQRRLLANPGKLTTRLLSLCVKKIGDISPVTDSHARKLIAADRQTLQLAVRKASLGSVVKDIEVVCPNCDMQNVFDYDLDEVQNSPMPDHTRGPLGEVLVEVTLDDGRKAQLRLATGEDEEAILPLVRANPEEANMQTLSRCLLTLDGTKPDFAEFIESDCQVVDDLTAKFADLQPGPEAVPMVRCAGCSRETFLEVSIVDFFFPSRSRGRRSKRR